MAKPSDSKTEKATPKRKKEARKRGEAARSAELSQSLSLVAAIIILIPVLTSLWATLRSDTINLIQNHHDMEATEITGEMSRTFMSAAVTLTPMLAVIVIISVVFQVALVGTPNVWKLKPQFKGLNPKQGFKRIFSKQQLWELIRTILKLSVLSGIAFVSWSSLQNFLSLGPAPLSDAFDRWRNVLESLAIGVAILGIVIGLGDAVISKRNFVKGLNMSKHEVKEETKQSEGDPLIKSQIRQAQQKMSRARMMAAVSDATVVVTNPTHYSVALAYTNGDPAPVVVAKGADELALRIRKEARKHGVPIKENKPVARSLYATAEIGDAIPVALYKAVAQLLASIYAATPNGAKR